MQQIFRGILVGFVLIAVLGIGSVSAQDSVSCPVLGANPAVDGTLDQVNGMICRAGEWVSVVAAQQMSLDAAVTQQVAEHGQVAWHQDTVEEGHPASPVGALDSSLPILAETWGSDGAGNTIGFVVTIPAGSVAWFQSHYGGTGWWVSPEELEAAVLESVQAITDRDGVAPMVIRLPENSFPLLGCLQVSPIIDGVRGCATVGSNPSFGVQIGEPFPGYIVPTDLAPQSSSSQQPQTTASSQPAPVTSPTLRVECRVRKEPAGSEILFVASKATPVVLGVEAQKDTPLNGVNYTWQQVVVSEEITGWAATTCLDGISSPAPAASSSSDTTTTGGTFGSGSSSCAGPAIVEDGSSGYAAKVNVGETLMWSGTGNCWPVDSQNALEPAWADHKTAFLAKYPNAPAYDSASEVPNAG